MQQEISCFIFTVHKNHVSESELQRYGLSLQDSKYTLQFGQWKRHMPALLWLLAARWLSPKELAARGPARLIPPPRSPSRPISHTVLYTLCWFESSQAFSIVFSSSSHWYELCIPNNTNSELLQLSLDIFCQSQMWLDLPLQPKDAHWSHLWPLSFRNIYIMKQFSVNFLIRSDPWNSHIKGWWIKFVFFFGSKWPLVIWQTAL